MLNGSKRNAPVSNRARLIAIGPAAAAPVQEGEAPSAEAGGGPARSSPKWMQWLVLPLITLLSALAGALVAWLLR